MKRQQPDGKECCIRENGVEYTLEMLMRQFGNDVLRLAFSYVKDYDTAEDMFQEVFIKVNARADGFRGDCSVKTWLLRITANTCKDYLKSAYHRRVSLLGEEVERTLAAKDTLAEVEKKEDARRVREALFSLPEKYREVLVGMYLEERSVTEVAKLLRISEGTVKSRLSRGRDRLKKVLEERQKGGVYDGTAK